MPSISLPMATLFYNVSNIALVTGAVVVLAGTIGTVWMGSVKERYGDDRIAANEAETARAKESAAKADERAGHANEGAAEANRRAAQLEKEAAEARSEQERLKIKALELEVQLSKIGPRRLTAEKVAMIVDASSQESSKPLITFNFASDPESGQFADIIAQAFTVAGWACKGGSRIIGNLPKGLTVYDPTGSLQRVLRKANIEFSEGPDRQSGTYITVGEKPSE